MAAKRRKVWVNEYKDGTLSKMARRTRAELIEWATEGGRAVPFVEARPGDVVLSREQQEAYLQRLRDALARTGVPDILGQEFMNEATSALLRGGR